MHSSWMRTVRSSGRLMEVEVSAQGGFCLGGGVCPGGCLPRGVYPGGCLPRGVCWGVSASGVSVYTTCGHNF